MRNKINIAELLKDCPCDMELNCTIYEDVYFDYVDEIDIIHCYIQHETYKTAITLNQYGIYNSDIKSKCVIFPKGKTTWEGFVPPCQFKDGDIVSVTRHPEGTWIGIFKQYKKTSFEAHCFLNTIGEFHDIGFKNHSLRGAHLATKEEKQKLFQAIKDNGYRWNEETKTLEKLVQPKFKVGDKIFNVLRKSMGALGTFQGTISEITDDKYIFTDGSYMFINSQDNYELVSDKFDITSLKPFDKVLVRDSYRQIWAVNFFSHNIKEPFGGYAFACIGHCWHQCIPYEGNQHLLGTTDNCDEYFKTWK